MSHRRTHGTVRTQLGLMLVSLLAMLSGGAVLAEDYYTTEQVYNLRPKPSSPRTFGYIGPTGILAHIEKDVTVTIEGTHEGSPAEGKFNPGEVILAVNGQSLKGLNPYVVLGNAITAAEAKDGTLTFELGSEEGARSVTIQIPVLGAYGPDWPVNCPKSRKIVENAAAFYHKWLSESKDMGISGALPCLFLLSTGDDAHLPVVKKHLQLFLDKPDSIGSHTWNNGYNGIACAEYYLRTGDKSVLPILQAICDDAKRRQNFDSAWKHWGEGINPGYVSGGLMNPASTQVLTTLLLSKEAGVDVDETTLHNALRYFWRFVGHGSTPYGDHRGEGAFGSNGKNAMTAVAMQAASGAEGDTSIYRSARDHLSMCNLYNYPGMATGHADNGRGDAIWRGIGASYLMEKDPTLYRKQMNRITWWFDLSRFHDGSLSVATVPSWNKDVGSGAAVAMTYTAPLKKLRILGAPRSEYATKFELPEHLWGNEADLQFHSLEPADRFEAFGQPLAMHQISNLLGNAYSAGAVGDDPDATTQGQLQRLVRHSHYPVRTQAAKALRVRGDLKTLEALLTAPDPRLRRAALDGLIDWRYWFATGKDPLPADRYTPGMIKAIEAMLANRDESLYVMEGALFAIGFMPVEVAQRNMEAIKPWTEHEEWWLRQASFMALQGLKRDPEQYKKVVPTLIETMIAENHTMPRGSMNKALAQALKTFGADSEIGALLAAGFQRAVSEGQVLEGPRGREAKFNLIGSLGELSKTAPAAIPEIAALLAERGFSMLDDDEFLGVVSGGRGFNGFLSIVPKLKGDPHKSLEDTLYDHYRPEIARRLKAGGGKDMKAIDAIIAILDLRDGDVGWTPIGTPEFAKRTWHYTSFDPTAEKDILPRREGRRYREVELPEGMDGWYKPEFDPEDWKSGQAPIGKGGHPRGPRTPVQYPSAWGEGEILLARTTFELDTTDFDMLRLRIMCANGFIVYLNGKRIRQYTWWADQGEYRKWPIGKREAKLLKKGQNTLAVYAISTYPSEMKAHWKNKVFGEMDCYIEALNREDLY